MNVKDNVSVIYYSIGAVSFILMALRMVYSWYRDYDNANRFTSDMALIHLPYIHQALRRVAERLGVDLDPSPMINFSRSTHQA